MCQVMLKHLCVLMGKIALCLKFLSLKIFLMAGCVYMIMPCMPVFLFSMHVFRGSVCFFSNHSMIASLRGSDTMLCAAVASVYGNLFFPSC